MAETTATETKAVIFYVLISHIVAEIEMFTSN